MLVRDKTFQIVSEIVSHNKPSYEYHLPGKAKSGIQPIHRTSCTAAGERVWQVVKELLTQSRL